MRSPPEYCPKCHGSRDMILSLGLGKVAGSTIPEEEVLLLHFHCQGCLTYIKTLRMRDLEATLIETYDVGYRVLEKNWLQPAHAI